MLFNIVNSTKRFCITALLFSNISNHIMECALPIFLFRMRNAASTSQMWVQMTLAMLMSSPVMKRP